MFPPRLIRIQAKSLPHRLQETIPAPPIKAISVIAAAESGTTLSLFEPRHDSWVGGCRRDWISEDRGEEGEKSKG